MVEKKKKITIFRLDASYEKGMGHLYRMKTLANEFRKNGFECIFVLRYNEIAVNILNDTPFNYLLFPEHYSEEEIIDKFFLEYLKPDLWIFDILSTENEWVSRVKKNYVPVVCFDDIKGGAVLADLLINPIAGCWEDVVIQSNLCTKILSGPRYAIIDPDITKLKKSNILPKKTIKVGVSMGGSDTHGATVKISKDLLEIEEDFDLFFFLGPHFSHDEELNKLLLQSPLRTSIKKAVQKLHKELARMDVVICGGGQTLFELSAMGVAILSLANEAHEEKTISYFARHGACFNIGSVHNNTIDTRQIKIFFKKLRSEPKEIHLLKTNAQRLVDGAGTSRVYNECVKVIDSKRN